MTAPTAVDRLLERFERLGVRAKVVGGELDLSGPDDALSDELLEEVRGHKAAVLEHLQASSPALDAGREPRSSKRTPAELVDLAAEHHVRVHAKGDRLELTGPVDRLPQELLDELADGEAEVVRTLASAEQAVRREYSFLDRLIGVPDEDD